jgi:hypothetical protein
MMKRESTLDRNRSQTTAHQPVNGEAGQDQRNWRFTGAELVPAPVRDPSTGRFLKGHPALAGGGRPPKSREQQNLDQLHEMLDEPVADGPTRISLLILSTFRAALSGDAKARELLYRYLLPPSVERQAVLALSPQVDCVEPNPRVEGPPWEQKGAAETVTGAIETLRDVGLIEFTPAWHQVNGAEPDETEHVV